MKVSITGIVEEVGKNVFSDGKKSPYFDIKQKGNQYKKGEIIRVRGDGVVEGDTITFDANVFCKDNELKVYKVREQNPESEDVF